MNEKKDWIRFSKPTISKKDLIHVLEGMLLDQVGEGPVTHKFEQALANYIGVKEMLVVSNVSAALFLIFKHIGLKEGDEVVLSAYVSPWILEVVSFCNATPVLVDLAADSLHVDLDQAVAKTSDKTKAVLISHQFGFPIDITSLPEEKRDWVLIEDCSEALGARVRGEHVGKKGDFAFFSFNENNLITAGQGGGVISKVKKSFMEMREEKSNRKGSSLVGRLDFSFTDLQAALGCSEISLIEKFIRRRYEIADFFQKACQHGKNRFFLLESEHVNNHEYFPIRLFSSLKIAKELFKKYKVEVCEPYEKPAFEMLGLPESDFPHTRDLSLKTLFVPIYPVLTQEEIENIGKLITNIR